MGDRAVQRDNVLAALEQLLGWPEIARSPQLAGFLDYIVRHTLDGDEQSIKAYTIAVDVFGRPADFDPQADPIVRVQARRLRALLGDYYRDPAGGATATVRIALPTGRYVPEFFEHDGQLDASGLPELATEVVTPASTGVDDPGDGEAPAARRVAAGFSLSWFAAAVIMVGIVITAYAIATWGPRQISRAQASGALQRPSVAIAEFQNLARNIPIVPLVSGLAIELVTDLSQFEMLDVRYGGGNDVGARPPAPSDYVLTGIVRADGSFIRYSALLTERVTSTVVWNKTISLSVAQASTPGVLDEISRTFSQVLGSPRGPLHTKARQLIASGTSLEGRENLYVCRMLFDVYRETGAGAPAERAMRCLNALPEPMQDDPSALAARASLIAEYASPAVVDVSGAQERYRLAVSNLRSAIVQAPVSGFVWEQQARVRAVMGLFDQARGDYRSAIQLNPSSNDALAGLALLLALNGNLDEATALEQQALVGEPDPPLWYQGVVAIAALRAEDSSAGIAAAELYAEVDREVGPILAIMAAQKAGDSAVVNRYLPEVLDVATFRTRGIVPRLMDRISDEAMRRAMTQALLDAGLPAEALSRPF